MCEECDLLASDRVVGSDEFVTIAVPKSATAAIKVIPKQHGPLTELEPTAQQRLLSTANMLSSFVFEKMEVQGTNIIIRDEEHAYALILGRTEQDGIDVRWQPKKATQQELTDVAKKISDEAWYIGKEKQETPKKYIEKTAAHPKKIEVRADAVVPSKSSRLRIGYEDPDPTVDTPDEVARDFNTVAGTAPKKDNYLLKHLTRRR